LVSPKVNFLLLLSPDTTEENLKDLTLTLKIGAEYGSELTLDVLCGHGITLPERKKPPSGYTDRRLNAFRLLQT
jgi:hypothetical protein